MSIVHTFGQLMTKFNVVINNTIGMGAGDYLDQPVIGKLFTGHDRYHRAFVNIPVLIELSDAELSRSCCGEDGLSTLRTAFVVFQIHKMTDHPYFVIGGKPHFLDQCDFLGEKFDNFDHLELLLAGATLQFKPNADPTQWIRMSLDRTACDIPTSFTDERIVDVIPVEFIQPSSTTQPTSVQPSTKRNRVLAAVGAGVLGVFIVGYLTIKHTTQQ